MEISFNELEKKCKECADEFLEELELLPVFLNYYPDVQEKWLEDIGLSKEDILKIKQVVDEYAKKKVELENKETPQKREEVIKIEDQVLKGMYRGIVLSVEKINEEFILDFLKSKYPKAAVLGPEQLQKLENLTLFKDHVKRFPVNFLVFDPGSNKITGYEAVER